jgi:FixJ family two-component response regulator
MGNTRPLVAIVDDDGSVCRALERLLNASGFAVETFGDGATFLQSLGSRRPDCLVLDLHMQGISGLDVQAKLRERGEPLPVVFMAGEGTPQSRARAIDGGAAAYLLKPPDPRSLLEAVTAAIASGRTPKPEFQGDRDA